MKGVVVDCSVTISWCLHDSPDAYAERVLDALPTLETVLVPAPWRLEVVNVLLSAERRGRATRAQALRFLDDLQSLPIRVESSEESSPMASLLRLAAERGLTAYDAAYLDCAARKGLALATLDEKLRQAGRAAGVELYLVP
jgi:predicted nucleic acid-binding protein